MINPNLKDKKYLYVLTSVKKKINIAKIRTNYHDLHGEIGCWSILKTPWDEQVCHLCHIKMTTEKNFLLKCPNILRLDLDFKRFVTRQTFLTF